MHSTQAQNSLIKRTIIFHIYLLLTIGTIKDFSGKETNQQTVCVKMHIAQLVNWCNVETILTQIADPHMPKANTFLMSNL